MFCSPEDSKADYKSKRCQSISKPIPFIVAHAWKTQPLIMSILMALVKRKKKSLGYKLNWLVSLFFCEYGN